MTYKASLDSLAKAITITVMTLALIVPLSPLVDMVGQPFRLEFLSGPVLIITFEGVLLFLCRGFAPQSYTITNHDLIINRSIKPPVYPLSDIREIAVLEKGALWSGIRTFGVGGLFGYFGLYWHHRFGHLTLYATQSDNKILITFRDNKKIIVTPDSSEMLYDLQRRLK